MFWQACEGIGLMFERLMDRLYRWRHPPTTTAWTPCLVLTAEEREEFERRRAGRICYYADDKGWPIPE